MRILKQPAVILLATLFAVLVSASSSVVAQSGDTQTNSAQPIGIILSTRGMVTAEAEDGTVRNLRRRSKIYEGDVVITAVRARAQIRFNDNGLVSLRPDTRFAIEEHTFNGQEDGTESATYRLLRGGLQAITGLIGNKNKSRYRFETPLATIGLRGTHWAATFCSSACGGLPPGLYGGVADGGIDVCNGGGCEGFDKDGYFYVPDADTKPQTLIAPPSVVFEDSTGRDEEDEDDEGDGSEGGDGEGDGQAGEGEGEGEGDEQANEGDGESEGDGQAQGGDEGGSDGSAGTDDGSGEEGGSDGSQGGDGGSTTGTTGNTDGSASQFGGNQGGANEDSGGTTTPPNTDTNPTDDPDQTILAGEAERQRNENCAPEEEAAGQCSTTTVTVTEAQSAGGGSSGSGGNGGDGDGGDGTGEPNIIDEIGATVDSDGDGVPNGEDAFPDDPNEIADTDGDGIGDNADTDRDGDGVPNDLDPNPDTADQFADADGDGVVDIIDPDRDGDGVENDLDPNPDTADQFADSDGDGIFDILDPDRDGDGIANADDPFPDVPDAAADLDGDGIIDSLDPDRDGDGVPNDEDAFPGNADEFADLDGDGIGDNSDPDRDGDGVANDLDPNPDTADEFADTDGDGVFDILDPDADGDGVLDELGEIPAGFVAIDSDGDGVADTLAEDSDGDGIADVDDPTPNGDPDPTPTPSPGVSLVAVVAMVTDRASDQAISDAIIDNGADTITLDAAGNVVSVTRNNAGCDPCMAEVLADAVLQDSDSYTNAADNISVLLGRWEAQDVDGEFDGLTEITDEADNQSFSRNLHFAVTEDVSDSVPGASFPVVGRYHLAMADSSGYAATSPTDGAGDVGDLSSATLTFDFFQQQVLGFDLVATFEGGARTYSAQLDYYYGPFNILDIADSRDLPLAFDCFGGVCGSGESGTGRTSFVFVGDTASAVTGSYSLNTPAAATSIAGAYVLELDNDNLIDPLVLDAIDSPLAPSAVPSGSVLLTSIGIIDSSHGLNRQLLDRTVDPAFSVGDFYIFPNVLQGFSASTSSLEFDVRDGMVLDFFNAFATEPESDFDVFYGLWTGNQALISGASSPTPGESHHFIWTDAPTASITGVSNQLAYYSLAGATPPTDENGNFGQLNRVELVLNYYSQSVADFNLDLSISDRNYQARIDRSYGQITLGTDMDIRLIGECFGADCGPGIFLDGDAHLQMVGGPGTGSSAPGVIGVFDLLEDPYGGPSGPGTCIGGCVATSVAAAVYSATGTFVLEETDQPLPFGVVDPDITDASNGGPTTAALVGTTFVAGSALDPAATIVVQDARSNGGTAGPDGSTFASREYGNLGFASLPMSDNTIEALAEVTVYAPGTTDTTNDNVILVEDGYLAFHGEETLGDADDVQAYWGNWLGGINSYLFGSGPASGNPIDHVHYIYTDDFTTDLRFIPLEKLEIWYHYVGGPLPADQDGNLGHTRYVNMGVNFYQAEVTYFESSFDIGGDYYYAEFDPYDTYYGSGSGAAIEEHDGIFSAIFDLDGNYDDCGECSNPLTGEAIVAFAGANSEVVTGTLAVTWSGGSATQGFVLEESAPMNVFDRADTDTFSTLTPPTGAIAAIANISAGVSVDSNGRPIFVTPYASYANLAFNNSGTGDTLELIEINNMHMYGHGGSSSNLGGNIFVSAYNSASAAISNQIGLGTPVYADDALLGPQDDTDVYWGLWHATQTFEEDGVDIDVINWMPFAYSPHMTASLPSSPITGFNTVHFVKAGGTAVNEYGQQVSLDSINMVVDFDEQEITGFDLTASYVDMSDNINYTATLDDTGVALSSASDIYLPLEGGCTGCGVGGSTNYDMQGSTVLSFVGNNAEGAIGSFQLDSLSSTDGSHSGSPNGLYSLAGAYALEQQTDFSNWYDIDLELEEDAPNDGVGFGAAVLSNSIGDTSASGYATSGMDVVNNFVNPGDVHNNSIVFGNFMNFDCLANAGGDCLLVDLERARLNQVDEVSTGAFTANLGRWLTSGDDSDAEYEDNSASIQDYFHFAFSSDDTMDITAVSSFIVKYSLYDTDGSTMLTNAEFTNPTDQNGVSGHIDYLTMEVDFLNQQITAFDIEAGNGAGSGTGGFHITASLPSAVPLAGSSIHSFGLVGMATDDNSSCTSDCLNDTATGIVNLSFLGSQAEGVLGAYNLSADTLVHTDYGSPNLAGAFLLDTLQASDPAPAGSVALGTGIIDAGTGTSIASILTGTGKNAISFSGVGSGAGVITHDNGAMSNNLTFNALASGVFSGDMTNFDAIGENLTPPITFDCTNCLEVDLTPGPADLSDTVKHVATNYTAYWGRWSDQPVTINQGSGDENYNAADLFYAYSEDLTADTSSAAQGTATISYSKILGSNPIDQDGVSGTLGAVTMDINFGSQQITEFDINLSTADGDWYAHLPYVDGTTIQEAVALSGVVNSFAVEGLASDPTGGITAAGTSDRYDIYGDVNTALLGPNADAVLGTYNLSVIDTLGAPQDAEAIGTFLLEDVPM